MYLHRLAGILIMAGAVALPGCATQERTGTVVGTTTGAAAGALIDDEAGALIGALAGGLIGREVGEELDQRDRRKMGQALENNPTGRTTTWQNPDTGRSFNFTPTQTYTGGERPCREFRMNVEGQQEDLTGLACRRPDGTWEVEEQPS
ncbi:glycine zipper domain-containing protein [Marinobacter sp.]|uniref:glycine zipper domain-containing protein n=1 Tax=Marinobacter sp. TaxID=50741 RepID=UPI00384BF6F3